MINKKYCLLLRVDRENEDLIVVNLESEKLYNRICSKIRESASTVTYLGLRVLSAVPFILQSAEE